MKKILFSALFIISAFTVRAQIDTLFWFAPPDITQGHAQDPVSLNISTFGAAAQVTISVPDSSGPGGFTPIIRNIPANSFDRVVLEYFDNGDAGDCAISPTGCSPGPGSQLLSFLETTPPNTILSTGLLIESTEDITVYYEVLGSNCDDEQPWIPNGECAFINTDIFSLKGNNALGTDFWISGQNGHYTGVITEFETTNAKSSFDIVATEDNTTITIELPTGVAAVGHAAGTSWTVNLNRGQTYSVEALDDTPGSQIWRGLDGTHVTSDQNIAITIKDDSVGDRADYANGNALTVYDLAGDQIIPITHSGLEYIIQGGYMYLTSTQTTTSFTVTTTSGTTNYNMTNAGETVEIDLRSETSPAYIVADKPVMNFHLNVINGTNNDPEFGGAIVPQINCTGSPQVVINRSTDEPNEKFFVNILVKTTAVNDFLFNGVGGIITAADFDIVPGTPTPGEWSYMFRKDMTTDVSIDSTHIITNTSEVFHLATVNGREWTGGGQNSTGSRYGYFSNFEQLIVNIDVSDQCITPGDSIQVGVANGFNSVDWSTGATSDSIWINTSGNYWVVVENSLGCTDSVNFNVEINTAPDFKIPDPQLLCPGALMNMHIDSGSVGTNATYEWTLDGIFYSSDSSFSASDTGVYILTVTNGCDSNTDTTSLSNWGISVPNIFTPNGDGINETFDVPGLLTQGKWELTVVNRWGEKVYYSESYDNTWNGLNQKGNELSEGTFFFYLIDKESEECNEYKGWVQIMR